MLLEQMELMRDGGEPTMNVLRDSAENTGLEFPVIPNEAGEWVGATRGDFGGWEYRPQEAGYSRDGDKITATMLTWKDFDREAASSARR
jgi:hypothetical protein